MCATLFAKAQEVFVRVSHGDFFLQNPRAPLLFEVVHVPTRGEVARIFMRVGRKAQGREWQKQGALVCFVLRPNDHNVFFDQERILRHVIMEAIIIDNLVEQATKLLYRRTGAAFVAQELKADPPGRLCPAMFARNFIEATLQRLAKEELLPAKGQNIVVLDRIEHPISKRDLDIKHAPISCLSHDFKGADEPKGAQVFLTPLADARLNLCAFQAAQSIAQEFIPAPRSLPVGRNQQIMRLEAHMAAHLAAFIQCPDALANTVDQDVSIMHRRKSLAGRCDLNPVIATLIATYAHIRLG